jgi:hypothetical protein
MPLEVDQRVSKSVIPLLLSEHLAPPANLPGTPLALFVNPPGQHFGGCGYAGKFPPVMTLDEFDNNIIRSWAENGLPRTRYCAHPQAVFPIRVIKLVR